MATYADFRPSATNPRQTDQDKDLDRLAASIRENGLVLPIAARRIKRPRKGAPTLELIDGHRRLAAIGRLVEAGKWPADREIPCHVLEGDDADQRARAIAANIERLPLHPVDQHEAFAALAEAGLDAGQIARRFALNRRQVAQALALGRLHPIVRQAWRDELIDEEIAQVFAPEEMDRQAEVFHRLAEKAKAHPHGGVWAGWSVRQEFRRDREDVLPLLNVIGTAAYTAAGGQIVESLFEEDDVRVTDVGLLARLAAEATRAEVERLREAGFAAAFSLAEPPPVPIEWRDFKPWVKGKGIEGFVCQDEQDRPLALAPIVDLLLDAVPAESRPELGVVIDRMYGGRNRVRTFDAAALTREPEAPRVSNVEPAAAAPTSDMPQRLTNALLEDVCRWRTAGFRSAFGANPDAMFRLLTAVYGSPYCPVWDRDRPVTSGGINIDKWAERLADAPATPAAAAQALAHHVTTNRYSASDADVRILAGMLDPDDLRQRLVEAFTPHAEEFFSRANQDVLVEAATEIQGEKPRSMKKAELVAYMAGLVQESGWLPPEMRGDLSACKPQWED
jgi:ParB/RepB/Spo0J family partition protein